MKDTKRLEQLTQIIEGSEASLTTNRGSEWRWKAAMKVNRHNATIVTRYGHTPREAIDALHRAILAVRFVPSVPDQEGGA